MAFRQENCLKHPDWHNAPVPPIGSPDAQVLIAGLAPGLAGANRTGVPFTGDGSGDALFAALETFGFVAGQSDGKPVLHDCAITNVVRCVPPQNRPVAAEIANCRPYLIEEMAGMRRLRAVLCLGRISHDAVLRALGLRLRDHAFAHGAEHDVDGLRLFDSYHCSRYNMNTGRLTPAMFAAVIGRLRDYIDVNRN
ncbi:uracil-DNA glycosylase [Amaricoccus tamworthensis]|uniref:uracil-DNA glycosylase n=1 Tax=Amaricoccus tamworthensis TaxID=57002 RepID=UPI003C7DADF2